MANKTTRRHSDVYGMGFSAPTLSKSLAQTEAETDFTPYDPNDDQFAEIEKFEPSLELTEKDQLDLLISASRTFFIKKLQFEFVGNDKIFHISRAQEGTRLLKRCMPCDFVFTDKKQMVFCQFCGLSACQECTKKTRIFPGQVMGNSTRETVKEDKRERGTICKLCDRKFFIKEMMTKSMKDIEMQNNVINQTKGKLQIQNNEIEH